MLYHVSHTSGITILEPKVSTHKKAYVYAIDNLVTGLLFGVPQDDFDFSISTEEDGTPYLYECYPHAFQKVYEGKGCSVYEVGEEGFMRGMTSWSPELVSEQKVPVLRETVIPDLYSRLLTEEEKGSLVIHRYEDTPAYKERIAKHIVDRIIRFGILDGDWEQDDRFSGFYRPIIEALSAVMDGHLL